MLPHETIRRKRDGAALDAAEIETFIAGLTSGTVDMPTRSAPRILAARISAGVSKLGPENHM